MTDHSSRTATNGEPSEFHARQQAFLRDLAVVVNGHSRENASNTPDYILAEFMASALQAFENASRLRERWYGSELKPGGSTITAASETASTSPEQAIELLRMVRPYLDMIAPSVAAKRPLVMVQTKCDAEALAKRIDEALDAKAVLAKIACAGATINAADAALILRRWGSGELHPMTPADQRAWDKLEAIAKEGK